MHHFHLIPDGFRQSALDVCRLVICSDTFVRFHPSSYFIEGTDSGKSVNEIPNSKANSAGRIDLRQDADDFCQCADWVDSFFRPIPNLLPGDPDLESQKV